MKEENLRKYQNWTWAQADINVAWYNDPPLNKFKISKPQNPPITTCPAKIQKHIIIVIVFIGLCTRRIPREKPINILWSNKAPKICKQPMYNDK